jgi:hypothetical protein
MKNSPKGKETDKRPLNLGKFAPGPLPPASDAVDEGPTLQLRRIAAKVVQKRVPNPEQESKDFGLPLQEMLGVLTQCYARGVFCSKDIADLLREDPKLRAALGRKLPTEDAIRTFRRRYAGEIEEALEGLYRAYPGGGPAPATPETAEGTHQLRREAVQRLHQAAHTDNTKGRLG